MPEKRTLERAAKDKRQGKSTSIQSEEFVREEIHHIRRRKHGGRSTKQAIAIGLSKARRAGVKVPGAKKKASFKNNNDKTSTQSHPKRAVHKVSTKISHATTNVLKREGHNAVSKNELSKKTRSAAKKHSPSSRSAAAKKASQSKGATHRSAAACKAANTRARRRQTHH